MAALVFAWGFWELAEGIVGLSLVRFDVVLSGAIQSLRSPALTPVMYAVTTAGGTLAVTLVVVIAALLLWREGHRLQARLVAVTVLFGMSLSWIAKDAFGRARPPVENALIKLPLSFSFPSGHTMGSLCVAFALGYVVVRSRLALGQKTVALAGLAAYAVLVGVSRIYLGVHWPSDVLASWLLAGAWLSLVIPAYEGRRRRGVLARAE